MAAKLEKNPATLSDAVARSAGRRSRNALASKVWVRTGTVRLKAPMVLAALSAAGAFMSGCSIGGVVTNRAPSVSARVVQKWAFTDFARDIEAKSAHFNVASTAAKPADEPVVLVPGPSVSEDAFTDMKRRSEAGDEVAEFVDVLDGRYFFCLTRDGRIVKSYEFENRAQDPVAGQESAPAGGRPSTQSAGPLLRAPG